MFNSESNITNKIRFYTKFLFGKVPEFYIKVGLSSPAAV